MPTWMSALKQWNAKSGTWCVPRKGSLAYAEVLKLMHPEAEGLVKKMKQEIEIKIKTQMKKEESDKRKAKPKKLKKTINIYADF
jgi:hypothetical protein